MHNHSKFSIRKLFYFFIILLLVVSCNSPKPEELLIGKWAGEDMSRDGYWEFTQSTIIISKGGHNSMPFAFQYKLIGKDKLEMNSGFFAELGAKKSRVWNFTVTKKELTLSDADNPNVKMRFVRVGSSGIEGKKASPAKQGTPDSATGTIK